MVRFLCDLSKDKARLLGLSQKNFGATKQCSIYLLAEVKQVKPIDTFTASFYHTLSLKYGFAFIGKLMLDAIDYKLCELLQARGRASQLELAQAVNLSQPAVAERIRKLEEQGIINGYAAQVCARKLGKDITAFIGVFTNHPRYHEGFVNKITAIEEVQECHRVAGTDSYLLKIKTENTSSLDALIARIRSIHGVERTQTTIAMATLKESSYVAPTTAKADDNLSMQKKIRKVRNQT